VLASLRRLTTALLILVALSARFDCSVTYAEGAELDIDSLEHGFIAATGRERAFAKAGGVLVAGTDPTAGGGVIPGFANQRQLELLVEAASRRSRPWRVARATARGSWNARAASARSRPASRPT
jgi:hypothetical protein